MNEKALETVARAVAAAIGDNYEDAFPNKSEWIAERGERGGRFRDINEPFRCDYNEAAHAAITAYLAAMEAEGFVMVPVEPTARMAVAGANERENGDMELHARKWRAMIAARPNAKS